MLHNMRQPQRKMLEKDDKVTVGIFMFYFARTQLNEAYIINVLFAKSGRTFICCPDIYFFFKNI